MKAIEFEANVLFKNEKLQSSTTRKTKLLVNETSIVTLFPHPTDAELTVVQTLVGPIDVLMPFDQVREKVFGSNP